MERNRNHRIRALVSLLLSLILTAMTIVPAFAASGSYRWTDGTYFYQANINVNESSTSGALAVYPSSGNGTAGHTQGEATTISISSNVNVTKYWSSSALPSAYRTYVVYAMQDAGYGTSRTYTFSAPASATVLAKRKTGTYAITKDAKLHNGTWDIVRWTVSKSGTPTSETDEWCRSTTSYASGTLVSVLGALKTTSPYYATKID